MKLVPFLHFFWASNWKICVYFATTYSQGGPGTFLHSTLLVLRFSFRKGSASESNQRHYAAESPFFFALGLANSSTSQPVAPNALGLWQVVDASFGCGDSFFRKSESPI
jgi:hypothetical protein